MRAVREALDRYGIEHRQRKSFPQLHDPQWLLNHRDLTRGELAALLGCNPMAAANAFRKAGVQRQPQVYPRRFTLLDDREWLRANRHRHSVDIATELNCSAQSVANAMRRHDIERTSSWRRYPPLADRVWLEAQRNRSVADIALEVGCSSNGVDSAFRRLGIARPHTQRRYPLLGDRAWLNVNRERPVQDIAAELGCSTASVSNAFWQAGVRRPRPRRYPQLVDHDWLQAHRDRPTSELAELVGCSASSLDSAFRNAGIVRGHHPPLADRHPELNDRGWLRANHHRSARELAGEFHCSTTIIYRAYRQRSVQRPRAARPPKYAQLHDRAWLRANRRRSATELADEIGCSQSTIDDAYRRSGIERQRRRR